MDTKQIKERIRTFANFPKEGILYYDMNSFVSDTEAFSAVIDHLQDRYKDKSIDAFLGVESRGFIFGGAIAARMNKGLILARKPGKLPGELISESYDLEYGQATLEIQKDIISKGQKIVVIDDLLATGGTLEAACKLVERLGGEVAEIWAMVELSFLNGKDKLAQYPYYSLIQYDD